MTRATVGLVPVLCAACADLWACRCVACERELPGLRDMATRISSDQISVVAIPMDEDRTGAMCSADRRGAWKIRSLGDPSGRVPELYFSKSTPVVYVADVAGRMRSAHYSVGARVLPMIGSEAAANPARLRTMAAPVRVR